MHLLKQDAKPQPKSTRPLCERRPDRYNQCPRCGALKAVVSHTCNACRYARPTIIQPDDKTIRYIPLTQGQIAIVDAALYEWLNQWLWFAQWNASTKSYYARRYEKREGGGQRIVAMHRQILDAPRGILGDHINGNTLDDRRENLRLANDKQSAHNRRKKRGTKCRFIGVTEYKGSRWLAEIMKSGENFYLGYFDTEEEAARARDRKAIELHGEFAVLNFPRSDYT